MAKSGFRASELHRSVYWHEKRDITVVVHVDDCLCIGGVVSLILVDTLRMHCDLKKHLLAP